MTDSTAEALYPQTLGEPQVFPSVAVSPDAAPGRRGTGQETS